MTDSLSEQSVATYLRQHPEFFLNQEALLTTMRIPHTRGNAVSLVERQVSVLRDENHQLQRQLEHLIDAAQRNEALLKQIQRVISALLGAETLDVFFDTLYTELQAVFHTDAVVVRLFGAPGAMIAQRPEFTEYDAQIFTLFESVLGATAPVCGRLPAAQAAFLFGEQRIGSAVLISLGLPEPQGILALGSVEVARFSPGMSTDMLAYLGDMLSQMLRAWQRRF